MIKFLWLKAKKAKYYALAVLIVALLLGASPWLVVGLVIIAAGLDFLLEFLG